MTGFLRSTTEDTITKCVKQAGADGYTGVLYLYHQATAHVIVQWTGSLISQRDKEYVENNLLNIVTTDSGGVMGQTVQGSVSADSLTSVSELLADVTECVSGTKAMPNLGIGPSRRPQVKSYGVVRDSLPPHVTFAAGTCTESLMTSETELSKEATAGGLRVQTGHGFMGVELAIPTAAQKLYKCTDCNKVFTNSTNLSKHRRVHTGRRPYKCTICDKAFVRSNHLVIHQRGHTGEKPFKCDICFTRFSNKGDLVRHVRCHTGEKPYECLVCNKKFTRSNNLVRHQRNHAADRPYRCSVCNKTFVESDHLVRHERSHTGHRPHQCVICDKAFATKGDLARHHRTHTGEKPYQCSVCNRAFSRSSYLTEHEKTHLKSDAAPTMIHGGMLDGVITLHVSTPADVGPVATCSTPPV